MTLSIGEPPFFAEFAPSALALLDPPGPEDPHNFYPDPEILFIGPGDPHGPPYDQEFRDGVARLGFDERGPFTAADFSSPNALWIVWMTVPNPGEPGSSPDSNSGPIIPNRLFPFRNTATTIGSCALFSEPVFSSVPPLDAALFPPSGFDGHSHFPEFYVDNMFFALKTTDPVGSYTYALTVFDQGGAGWLIEADFIVVSGTDGDGDGD